ncbi:hypothetical protein ACLKA6_005824 [Drosophila palustris]
MKPSASCNRKPRQLMNGPLEYSSGCRPQVNDANGAVLFPVYRRDSADQPLLRRQIVLGDDHQLSNDHVWRAMNYRLSDETARYRLKQVRLCWSGAPPAGIAVNGPPINAWPGVSASPSLGSSLSAPIGRELSTASTATGVVCSSSAVNSRQPTVRRSRCFADFTPASHRPPKCGALGGMNANSHPLFDANS